MLHSEVGKGSNFFFNLPIVHEDQMESYDISPFEECYHEWSSFCNVSEKIEMPMLSKYYFRSRFKGVINKGCQIEDVKPPTVLMVDDTWFNRFAVVNLLKRIGIASEEA